MSPVESFLAELPPELKLGRGDKHVDPRNLKFANMRIPDFLPPDVWSWDKEHPGAVPLPMFHNDVHGCCVISGRAHQTLRFEFSEQGLAIPISDAEIDAEYFAETGGADDGLVVLYSLQDWRNKGWIAGGKRYKIHSYLQVVPQDHRAVMESSLVGIGLQFGLNLPISAVDQRQTGAPWTPVAGSRGRAGSWGGHLVINRAYAKLDGVEFVTWGTPQWASWDFIDEYCDECYCVIDDPNRAASASVVDVAKLEAAIADLN